MNYRASRLPGGRLRSAAAPAPVTDVVSTAEQIVRSALGREMLRAIDHAECAVQDSYREWDNACRNLVMAQRRSDPEQISAAHIALEQALAAVRESVEARGQLLAALRGPQSAEPAPDPAGPVGPSTALAGFSGRSKPVGDTWQFGEPVRASRPAWRSVVGRFRRFVRRLFVVGAPNAT